MTEEDIANRTILLTTIYNKIKINTENKNIILFENALPAIILTSRYNNETWEKSLNYRKTNNIPCIYSTPSLISYKIPLKRLCIVIEMNNDTNQILGFGLIRNLPNTNKNTVYNNNKYDTFHYVGKKWRTNPTTTQNTIGIKDHEKNTIELLENLLFYGNEHQKRGDGLKKFPIKYLYRLRDKLHIVNILLELLEHEIPPK